MDFSYQLEVPDFNFFVSRAVPLAFRWSLLRFKWKFFYVWIVNKTNISLFTSTFKIIINWGNPIAKFIITPCQRWDNHWNITYFMTMQSERTLSVMTSFRSNFFRLFVPVWFHFKSWFYVIKHLFHSFSRERFHNNLAFC